MLREKKTNQKAEYSKSRHKELSKKENVLFLILKQCLLKKAQAIKKNKKKNG